MELVTWLMYYYVRNGNFFFKKFIVTFGLSLLEINQEALLRR